MVDCTSRLHKLHEYKCWFTVPPRMHKISTGPTAHWSRRAYFYGRCKFANCTALFSTIVNTLSCHSKWQWNIMKFTQYEYSHWHTFQGRSVSQSHIRHLLCLHWLMIFLMSSSFLSCFTSCNMRGIFTTPGVLSYTSTNCVAPLNIVSTGIREVVSLGGGGGEEGGSRDRGEKEKRRTGRGEGEESYRIHKPTHWSHSLLTSYWGWPCTMATKHTPS